MHRTYSLRYGSFYICELIRTRFFAHHRRNIRKYNIRSTIIRNCVTVVMYRCEMASQRNKNQYHSSYRFWVIWFLPRLHVKEMLDFDGSRYNNSKNWKVGSMSILRRIGAWSPITVMYESSLDLMYFLRYGNFNSCKIVRTRFFAHRRRNIRKYNISSPLIRNCVTVVMYRCEIASQRNKNQCHSSYLFWVIWFLPRLHVKEMLDFDGSRYNNSKNWKVGSMSILRRIGAWSPITGM